MKHYLYWASFREMQGVPNQLTAGGGLRVATRVVPKPTTKSWVAWGLPSLYPAKERLESKVDTNGDVLQHLTVNHRKCGALLFQSDKARLLVVHRGDFAACLLSILTLCKQVVVEPTTLVKHSTHLSGLLTSWIYTVEEGFTHFFILSQNHPFSNH